MVKVKEEQVNIKEEKVQEQVHAVSDKELVVDIETLSFRPVTGQRLPTARRGQKFIPGNMPRKQWTGRVTPKGEKCNADITIYKSPYNEWLAAQGLLNLSEDQPKEGVICNLHKKDEKNNQGDNKSDEKTGDLIKEESKVMGEKSCDTENEIVKSGDQQNGNVKEDLSKNMKRIRRSKSVEKLQKPVPLKRQQYVKGKLSLHTH